MERVKVLKLTDTEIEVLMNNKIFTVTKKDKKEGNYGFYSVTIDTSRFKGILLNWFGMYKINKYITPEQIQLDFFDATPSRYPFTDEKLMMIRALYSTIGVDMPPVMTKEWLLKRITFGGPREWLDRINEELGIKSKA